MTTAEQLAREARLIAEKMRHDAKPFATVSTTSPETVFIPFAAWYDAVANELEASVSRT